MRSKLADLCRRTVEGLRLVSAPMRGLPDFLIAGAMKSGTSSLYNYLSEHPRLLPSRPKEVQYFCRQPRRSEWWYRQHFAPLWLSGLRYEATTAYLYFPAVAERIKELVPDVRILILLRNPVARAWSHYRHEKRRGREARTFQEAIREDVEIYRKDKIPYDYDPEACHFGYIRRGLYVDQIREYYNIFDSDNILILKSEDMFSDAQSVADQVFDFLGVKRCSVPGDRIFNSGSKNNEVPMQDKLQDYFDSHNDRLYNFLGTEPWWEYKY